MTKILCVPAEHLTKDVTPRGILELTRTHGDWIERDLAETDESWRQVIPYVLLATNNKEEEISFFVYQRKGGGEGRLEGLYSIGIGGHIEEIDGKRGSPVYDAALREAKEEVKVPEGGFVDISPNPLMCILLNDTPVDRVHVGIVYTGAVCSSDDSSVDTIEANEPELRGQMMSAHDLMAAYQNKTLNFEVWTKKVLSEMKLDK